MLSRCSFVVVAGLIAMLVGGRAMAQSRQMERARVAFDQGRAAYESGDFRVALERFQEAYELTHEPDLLYNVASAADRLREDRLALDSYRAYLQARPNTPDAAQVRGRITVLEERLAEEEQERTAHEAERAEREREERELREQLAQRPTTTEVVRNDPGPGPWILTAGGAALLVAGVVLIIVAEVDAACVREPTGCVGAMPMWGDVAERYDRIPIFQAVGGVLLGVGAAVAIGGLIWGVTAGSGGATTEVSVGPGSLQLRGRF